MKGIASEFRPWMGDRQLGSLAPAGEDCQAWVGGGAGQCAHRFARIVRMGQLERRVCGPHHRAAILVGWTTAGGRVLPKRKNRPPRQRKDAQARQVYFLRIGSDGPVKIGSSRDPAARQADLQTAHPDKLVLLGAVGGGRGEELRLHRKFSSLRLMGEWFRPDGELLEYIASVLS
jgi:hypothetical protein